MMWQKIVLSSFILCLGLTGLVVSPCPTKRPPPKLRVKEKNRAIAFHRQSLDIAREIGDRQLEAHSLSNLDHAYNLLCLPRQDNQQ